MSSPGPASLPISPSNKQDHCSCGRCGPASYLTCAPAACHVTQSTLSASIKELESVLQVTLVDRSKRHVVLTPVGVETVERARKIVKEVEDLVSFTTASREPLSSMLRMGAIPTVGPFLLPRVLPVCARRIAASSSTSSRT